MNILYVTQFFYPEVGATTNRALANVRHLTESGHSVTVLTEMPNHPRGIIFPSYRKKLFCREKMENFLIERVWVLASPKKNFITRMAFYLTYPAAAILWLLFHWKKYELVYVTSPPLFVALVGLFCKRFHPRCRLVFEIRDLWPDSAVQMGALKNKLLIKYSLALEKKIYQKADHLVPVIRDFTDIIGKKGIDINKITLIRNGGDVSFARQNPDPDLIKQYNLQGRFVAIYAGNLGIAQNLTTLLKAARILQNEKVSFIFLGAGPEEGLLKQFALDNKLENVHFTGEIAKDNVSRYMSLADCGIIPLKDIPLFQWAIPSKIFDCMAAELPVLLGVKGEAKEIVEEENAGIAFEPDNAEDLSKKIMYLKDRPELVKEMAANAKRAVTQKYDRRILAKELDIVIKKIFQ